MPRSGTCSVAESVARCFPAGDSGDHLHPSPAGNKAMADAIPLSLFAQ